VTGPGLWRTGLVGIGCPFITGRGFGCPFMPGRGRLKPDKMVHLPPEQLETT
jgi:hypothetical protein